SAVANTPVPPKFASDPVVISPVVLITTCSKVVSGVDIASATHWVCVVANAEPRVPIREAIRPAPLRLHRPQRNGRCRKGFLRARSGGFRCYAVNASYPRAVPAAEILGPKAIPSH